MDWYEIELDGRRTCNFQESAIPGYNELGYIKPLTRAECQNTDYIGGIINNGEWGWTTSQNDDETTLLIYSLSTGDRIAHYTFWRENQKAAGKRCNICSVTELFPGGNERRLLAVCLEMEDIPSNQVLAIFSPVGSQVLRYIELDGLNTDVSTINFVSRRVCGQTALQELDGCLVLGTTSGVLLLLDLNAQNSLFDPCRSNNINRRNDEVLRAEILRTGIEGERNWNFVSGMLKRARDLDMHLALEIRLKGIKEAPITSLLPIEAICGFAIGLDDGLVVVYDLCNCRIVTQLPPPANEPPALVESLCCVLPLDDPKPCLYICAVYNQDGKQLSTSLHSLIYQHIEGSQLRDFQVAQTRIRLLLDGVYCRVICCSAIASSPREGDGSGSLPIAIGWHSPAQSKNKLVLFDINQWYSDGMPSAPRSLHSPEKPNYLCGYILSGLHTGLALQLDEKSVMYFNGIQHQEEHYFPNALSFDCSLLTNNGCRRYSHLGVQRRFLNSLNNQQANLLLNPQPYQQEIMRLRLMPQFCEQQVDAVFSKRGMYELIFSVALEHNRMGLLKKCAQSCLDGSFMCNMSNPTQLSLVMLTKWMVTRAEQIKAYVTEMCHCIFDVAGYQLDEREQREFGQLNKQLHRLLELQQQLIELGKTQLSPDVLEDLQQKEQAFCILYEYQRVLYWIIDVGLLPERCEPKLLYVIMQRYTERRNQRRGKLYIDEMVQRNGLTAALQAGQASNLYPPHTFRALMQLMLYPDALLLHKHELLLYLLLDLDTLHALHGDQDRPTQLFDKFALAFNIGKPLVHSVRSFWYLDRGNCDQAIAELQRSHRESKEYTEWQMKLLIEQLLLRGAIQQAMQVLNHPPGHISSHLQLDVLLANDNIPEAFHHARLYGDEAGKPLLEHFFRHCIGARKFNVLGTLCLREEEEQLVYRLLRQCKTRKADCVQLILLLKRCKYIEAVSFMDEVAAERQGDGYNDDPNTILSAYRTTMAPVNQSIAGTYFRIRDNLNGAQLKNIAPEPFSCQLAKQNANDMVGGIFQSSALSAHWATRYATREPRMLNGPNMPFLRNAAQRAGHYLGQRRIVRPAPYQHVEKRSLEPEQGQAAKRRRVVPAGEQFTQDMGNFVQRMQQLKQADRERQLELERQQDQQRDREQVLALMKPPDYLQESEREQNAPSVAMPPTILRNATRRKYSFMLPIPLDGSTQEPQLQREESEQAQQEEEQDEEETDEIIVEIQPRTESRSESDTDEEYMSPLASANNSLVQSQSQQNHELAPPTGPQPRNSLQQLHQQQLQGSSGFGSFASSIQSGSTTGGTLFVPPVCSSKMVEVQQQSSVRISERTTICGDLNETSLAATASSLWAMPSVSLGTPLQRQPLQRLDTTLGMSSYDVTAAMDTPAARGAAVAQAPTEFIQLDDEEEQEAERNRSSEDEPVEMDYQPNSYSVSSELSDSGSPTTARPDAPVYSIVVESTTSITTSRSPTSNTPPSFLPSDTNVSQNSSPRATDGAGGGVGTGGTAADGSNRSIYRANSLETVDDLDTTKGSLEEDDDVDMIDEDECVIALDGTEVRGYVARPQPVATCSSAELFSFKKDETAEEGSAQHMPCPSLGATLGGNSDSAMDTINLDSVESTGEMADSDVRIVTASDPASSNESVATVHKQKEHQDAEQVDQSMDQETDDRPEQLEDIIDTMEESPSDQVILVESDCEVVDTTAQESDVEFVEQSQHSDADSYCLIVTVSDNEEEEEEEATDQQAEKKAQEEKKRQEEQLKQEKQKQEEMQQQEDKRLLEEKQRQEEEKRLQEEKARLEEQQREEEKQRQEEEKKQLEEEKRLQEERRLQEEKRIEEEKRQQEEVEEKQRQEEEKKRQEKKRLQQQEKQRQEEEKQRKEEERLQQEEKQRQEEEKQRKEEERLQQEEKQRQEKKKQRQKEKQRQEEEKQRQEDEKRQEKKKLRQEKKRQQEEKQREEEKKQRENDEEIEEESERMEIDEEHEQQQQKRKKKKQKNQEDVEEQSAGVSTKHPTVRLLRTRQVSVPPQAEPDSPAISPPPASTSTSPVLQKRLRLRSSDRKQSSSPTGRGTPSPVTARRQRAPSYDETGRELRRRKRSDDSVASVDSQAEVLKRQLRAGSMPAMSAVPVSTPKRRTRLQPKPLEVIQEIGETTLPRTRSRTQLNKSIAEESETPQRRLRCISEPPRETGSSAAAVKAPTKTKRSRKTSASSDTPADDSQQTRVLRSRRSTTEESQPAVSPAPSPTPEVSHANETNVPPKKRGRPRK